MAEVTLAVGGYSYKVACRDGEEAHFLRLGDMVDAKAQVAGKAVGNANEVRQMLFAALLFADEALEAQNGKSGPEPVVDVTPALNALAERIESLATRLEAQP